MAKPLFPKSLRKHIRQEKARIRREVSNTTEHDELIQKLLNQFLPKAKKVEIKKEAPAKQDLAEPTAKS